MTKSNNTVQGNSNSNPSKLSGKLHETKGGVKESIGRTLGDPGMQQSGAQERAEGHAEYQAATGQGTYGQGTKDRFIGKKDQVLGNVTGNRAQQTQGKTRHAEGAAQQRWNHDLQA